MTDPSLASPPPEPEPTIAQRALVWIGLAGVAISVWCFMADSFKNIELLAFAGFFCCALLVALPATLPAGLKASLAVGGGLLGTALIWALTQIQGEVAREVRLTVPILVAIAARVLADRWVRSRTPLARRDVQQECH